MLYQKIQEIHVAPKPLNNELSVLTHHLFIKQLDENKNIFTTTDLNGLKKHETQLDDHIKNKNITFIDDYLYSYDKAINNVKSIINSTTENIFSQKRQITFRGKNQHTFFETNTQLENYWKNKVLFRCLSRILINENANIEKANSYLLENKKSILQKHKQQLICELEENYSSGMDQHVKNVFLNALANNFDPHTNFFDFNTKQLFENSLSTTTDSFGFSMYKEDGEIFIGELLFGSKVWKENLLLQKDKILILKTNKQEIDLNCISIIELHQILNQDIVKKITLEVLSDGGSKRTVSLQKEKLSVSKNYVQAFVAKYQGKTFGYIEIPSFYTSFETVNRLGVANDFAKELVKLNRENISGLIIDLRNNGGGAIKEASNIAGMFIDKGPLGTFKYQDEEYVLKDFNRGVSFTKPIIVLTNNYSASASEYLAGIMQDYNVGIIMGSRTFGKGSGQIIIPLDEKNEALGFTKITTELIYKVSGTSYQSTGITPDIVYTNLFDDETISERQYENALVGTTLTSLLNETSKKTFKKLTISPKTIAYNKNVAEINTTLTNMRNKSKSYILNFENLSEDFLIYKAILTKIKNTNVINNDFQFSNTNATNEELLFDTDKKEINDILLKQLQTDKLLTEAIKTLTLNTN
ncbi:MAG: hypothetical protein HRT69_12685 [Flavobacteriaceae bacterium]|nr:hypothetical protein [Flavobacteriaceae bacterium]